MADEIKKIWRIEGVNPFVPTFDAKFRRKGIVTAQRRRLFPGYVFIESEMPGTEFWCATQNFIYKSNYALKLLKYGDSNGVFPAIDKTEQMALMKLFAGGDYCVGMSTGLIVGDKVKVTCGPLQNRESIIKKIKRHRMEAIIEIELLGESREVTVGLEIIKRI